MVGNIAPYNAPTLTLRPAGYEGQVGRGFLLPSCHWVFHPPLAGGHIRPSRMCGGVMRCRIRSGGVNWSIGFTHPPESAGADSTPRQRGMEDANILLSFPPSFLPPLLIPPPAGGRLGGGHDGQHSAL